MLYIAILRELVALAPALAEAAERQAPDNPRGPWNRKYKDPDHPEKGFTYPNAS